MLTQVVKLYSGGEVEDAFRRGMARYNRLGPTVDRMAERLEASLDRICAILEQARRGGFGMIDFPLMTHQYRSRILLAKAVVVLLNVPRDYLPASTLRCLSTIDAVLENNT